MKVLSRFSRGLQSILTVTVLHVRPSRPASWQLVSRKQVHLEGSVHTPLLLHFSVQDGDGKWAPGKCPVHVDHHAQDSAPNNHTTLQTASYTIHLHHTCTQGTILYLCTWWIVESCDGPQVSHGEGLSWVIIGGGGHCLLFNNIFYRPNTWQLLTYCSDSLKWLAFFAVEPDSHTLEIWPLWYKHTAAYRIIWSRYGMCQG